MISGVEQCSEQDSKTLAETLDKVGAIYKENTNVHLVAGTIGKYFNDVFLPLDTKYNVSFVEKYDFVEAEIIKYSNNNKHVMSVLSTIKQYANTIDSETKINALELLSRTWNLAKNDRIYVNARGLVIDNLTHNVFAGGGCLAGICVRLVSPYAHFLTFLLGAQSPAEISSYEKDLIKALTASLETSPDEDDMNKALAESIEIFQTQKNEQNDLEEALKLSEELFNEQRKKEKNDLLAKRRDQENEDAILAQKLLQEEKDTVFAQELDQEENDRILAKNIEQEENDNILANNLIQEENDGILAQFTQEEEDSLLVKNIENPNKKRKL